MPTPSSRLSARVRLTALALTLASMLALLVGVPLAPRAVAAEPSASVFGLLDLPRTPAERDTKPVEVGMKFRSSVRGSITGVRFYKGPGNTGSHTGSLWTTDGERLATVRFGKESLLGWQQARFASPVAIEADTTYVVSYYAPRGRYAATEGYWNSTSSLLGSLAGPGRGPVTGLANGADGANGVYRYGEGGGFPQSSYQATNYWVDVLFSRGGADEEKPTVVAQSPAADEKGVSRAPTITATFSEPVDPSSVTTVLSAGGAASSSVVATTSAYDAPTRTLSLRPVASLAPTTRYTVTISGATDTSPSKNRMDPLTWSFSTVAAPAGCPCTIFGQTTPAIPVVDDTSAVTLGIRFRSSLDGYVTGLRYYQGSSAMGAVHPGALWDNDGRLLASLTFSDASASGAGWRTAQFSGPVPVTKGTTYVASYYAPLGRYAAQNDFFTTSPTTNGPLTALASGVDGKNGVYATGQAFPTNEYRQTNYFADVVFDTVADDVLPPIVTSQAPAPAATRVSVSTPVLATLSEDVSGASIVLARANDASPVSGVVSYDPTTRQAKFAPSAPLGFATRYTATISGAKDAAGNTMVPASWSFTTAAEPTGSPETGPGGPIAVVTSAANRYSSYLAEILRTEGLNEFTTVDVSSLTGAGDLSRFSTVLLGDVALSDAQAQLLTGWVSAGGNVIAMRPRENLSSLLGLSPAGASLDDGYLKVDPATAPGAGIVSETIQYHGSADRYTADRGTTTVASLYSDATTPARSGAANPAVTWRRVGSAGGEAAAFTYDLARSVALTRQGNPAWAGTERDGLNPIRSDDYFFGGSAKDWVDLTKVAIPQADEQQRLLANLIQTLNRDTMPLPRFWYFPDSAKAVIVATGDDHANNGTAGRFDQWNANSPAACAGQDQQAAELVADWKCLRYSSYLWNNTPLSDAAAARYTAQGFEVGLHASIGPNNYTATSIFDTYAEQMAAFRRQYPSLPTPRSTRFHAIVFSDWASQPKAEVANGMNLDTNYYYWPDSWVQNRPGFMTGSGMAMRFTDTDGSMIDNYQAATQLTDESGQSYPYTIDTLLDNALDPRLGYYGSFVANMHTDQATEVGSDSLIASARSHGNVPIVSGKQLTDWLDGRNASRFRDLQWNSTSRTLSFGVQVDPGARNLVAMIPTAGPSGAVLSTIRREGATVPFTTTTIKGLEYASFEPTSGSYTVGYAGASGSALTLTSAQVVTGSAGEVRADGDVGPAGPTAPAEPTTEQRAALTWTTSRPASSEVLIGTSAQDLDPAVTSAGSTTDHDAVVTGLKPSTTYFYRLVSRDVTGRLVTSPAPDQAPARLVTGAADRADPVVRGLRVTAVGRDAQVSWTTDEPAVGGLRVNVPGSAILQPLLSRALTTKHSVTLTDLSPDTTYEIAVDAGDAAGNWVTSTAARLITPSAGTGQLTAAAFRTGTLGGSAEIADEGDGTLTLRGATTTARSGSFTSAVLDARRMVDWDRAQLGVDQATGAGVKLQVRTGDAATSDAGWTAWTEVSAAGRWRVEASSRYIQYRLTLTAPAKVAAPEVTSIGFTNNAGLITDPHETD